MSVTYPLLVIWEIRKAAPRKGTAVVKEKRVHDLSIFLVKSAYTTADQTLDLTKCRPGVAIPIPGHEDAHLFIKKTPAAPPRWVKLFAGHVNPTELATPGVSGALWIRVNGRCFVLAFGQAGRFLLNEGVFEERFGLICALNSVDPNSFRCIDVQSLDAIQSHTRIQAGQAAAPDQFGLNIEQDMLKAIVGAPLDEALGNRMAGSDPLSVSVPLTLADLPQLLDAYRKKFETELSAEDHQWVNNIAITRNPETIKALETELNAKLTACQFSGIWLAIPEIIDWSQVHGFVFTRGKGIHSDITLDGFLASIEDNDPITLDLLKQRKVYCADIEYRRLPKHWSVFRCLHAEIELAGARHVLTDGTWYTVAVDFVAATDAAFAHIKRSKLQLPKYSGGGEGSYNKSVAADYPTEYALLDDTKKVMHGGGHGQVEICDLFSAARHLIHVKIYGSPASSVTSFPKGSSPGSCSRLTPPSGKR